MEIPFTITSQPKIKRATEAGRSRERTTAISVKVFRLFGVLRCSSSTISPLQGPTWRGGGVVFEEGQVFVEQYLRTVPSKAPTWTYRFAWRPAGVPPDPSPPIGCDSTAVPFRRVRASSRREGHPPPGRRRTHLQPIRGSLHKEGGRRRAGVSGCARCDAGPMRRRGRVEESPGFVPAATPFVRKLTTRDGAQSVRDRELRVLAALAVLFP